MVEPLRFPENDLFKGWGDPLRCETTIEGWRSSRARSPTVSKARSIGSARTGSIRPSAPTTSSSMARA